LIIAAKVITRYDFVLVGNCIRRVYVLRDIGFRKLCIVEVTFSHSGSG